MSTKSSKISTTLHKDIRVTPTSHVPVARDVPQRSAKTSVQHVPATGEFSTTLHTTSAQHVPATGEFSTTLHETSAKRVPTIHKFPHIVPADTRVTRSSYSRVYPIGSQTTCVTRSEPIPSSRHRSARHPRNTHRSMALCAGTFHCASFAVFSSPDCSEQHAYSNITWISQSGPRPPTCQASRPTKPRLKTILGVFRFFDFFRFSTFSWSSLSFSLSSSLLSSFLSSVSSFVVVVVVFVVVVVVVVAVDVVFRCRFSPVDQDQCSTCPWCRQLSSEFSTTLNHDIRVTRANRPQVSLITNRQQNNRPYVSNHQQCNHLEKSQRRYD